MQIPYLPRRSAYRLTEDSLTTPQFKTAIYHGGRDLLILWVGFFLGMAFQFLGWGLK